MAQKAELTQSHRFFMSGVFVRADNFHVIPLCHTHHRTGGHGVAIHAGRKRPRVLRYRAFCDEVRLQGVELPENGLHVVFFLPTPASWSQTKKCCKSGARTSQNRMSIILLRPYWMRRSKMMPTYGVSGYQK